MKPLNTMMKSSQQNSYWNPHMNRVFYKKYINEVNEALQSLIVAGKLKRMELMSINNRALFNRGKVQRSQWTNKKHLPTHQSFLPDVKNLNLDARSPKQKSTITKRTKTQSKYINSSTENEQNIIDILIEQQLERMRTQKILNSGRSQQDIVKEACRAIQQKIIENQNKNPSRKQSLPIHHLGQTKQSRHRYNLARRDHRRSVTQSMYTQQLSQLNRKNNAFLKQVQQQKKYFLRKIKRFSTKRK